MYKYIYISLLCTLLYCIQFANGFEVTSITVNSYTTHSISVSVTLDVGVGFYYLKYFLNSTYVLTDSSCSSELSCTISGLSAGETYRVGACAANNAAENCVMQIVTLPISIYQNAIIVNSVIPNINERGMNIQWGVSFGVPSLPYTYTIMANDTMLSVNQTVRSYSIIGLQPETVYKITLILYNDDDSYQVSWLIQTYALDQIKSTLTSRRTKTLTLSYLMIGGIIGQTQYILKNSNNNVVYSQCQASATQCTFTDLTPNTTYSFDVGATNNLQQYETTFHYTTYPLVGKTAMEFLKGTASTITLGFSSSYGVPNETLYTLKFLEVNYPPCTLSSTNTCIVKDLNPDTQYTFQLDAINDGYTYSNVGTFKTLSQIQLTSVELIRLTTRSILVEYSTINGLNDTLFTTYLNGVSVSNCMMIDQPKCLIGGLSQSTNYTIMAIASSQGLSSTMVKNYTTLQSVSAPEIKVIQKSDLSLDIKYSSQYGYGPSVYEVTVNGAILPQCTNDSITCRFSPYNFNSTYEIVVKVTNDGSTNSTTLSYNIYNLPTAVKISNTSTISSISINWDESQEGIPNLTYYSASLSNNIGDNFIIFCDNVTSLLQCNFTSLTSNTTYLVRVSVYNSYFDAVNTTIQVSTLIDTRQNCKTNNNQECSGNGNCINNQCQCKSGWKGQYCEINNQNYNNPDISPNPETPVIAVDDKGIEFTFSLGFIQEIDQSINIIKSLNTSTLKWKLVKNSDRNINSTSSGTVLEKSWQYISENHEYFKSINIEFYQYLSIPSKTLNDYYQYEYAGQTYSIKLGSIKYTFNISEWNFDSKLNSIQLGSSLTSPIGGSCNGDTTITITDAGESKIIIFGDTNGNSVFGRLSNRVILDNIPRVVEHRATQVIGQKITIISIVPYFSQSLFLDPDFESLVSVDGPIECSDNKKTRIIIGAVVGGTVGLALLILTSILLYRKRYYISWSLRKKNIDKNTEMSNMNNRF